MNKFLEEVDEEIVDIITTVRKSDKDYVKQQERARIRDQQTQAPRTIHKPEYNFLTLNSSTQSKTQALEIRTDIQKETSILPRMQHTTFTL